LSGNDGGAASSPSNFPTAITSPNAVRPVGDAAEAGERERMKMVHPRSGQSEQDRLRVCRRRPALAPFRFAAASLAGPRHSGMVGRLQFFFFWVLFGAAQNGRVSMQGDPTTQGGGSGYWQRIWGVGCTRHDAYFQSMADRCSVLVAAGSGFLIPH